MFETAADNASILSIDLGLLLDQIADVASALNLWIRVDI